ncbi:ATP-binding protein [Tissierella sp. Yu-01]|uniref:ATP-binding protein n=1 Tax=Tissierella sp. Yu-01 TaxID=3035694 RepID=UPI00240D398E|nr:ATP-binding protein [Tissierella sp. Yu-01]WFA10380.1 ATP-binding protein [Tissierella sp. Yu-01]
MAKMRISGNIVDELSEKIPTYLVAINELIKNAFDAKANNIKIKFDSKKKTLSISDDGKGMTANDIETLLHISKSNKEYAKFVDGRYIQGSKGLGFLSVFKFGESVAWKTSNNNSNKGYEFKINYKDIIESESIEDIDIPILEIEDISRGTLIDICMTKESVLLFKEELENPQTIPRLLHSFNLENFNDSFSIILEIDGVKYHSNESINSHSILPERQLFNVKYNSNNSKVVFYHNNVKAMEYDFTFSYDDFSMDLDLMIFSLKAYDKKKINSLFYDNRNELTPLVYINTNLFNNYTLFDTNIMQKIKYSSIMNQIIGNINIFSSNQDLTFNSDRTQFVQNKLTTNISKFIENINIFIQEKASDHKKYLIDFNILTNNKIVTDYNYIKKMESEKFRDYIKPDFSFKEQVNILCKDNIVAFSLFNKNTELEVEIKKSEPSNNTSESENDDSNVVDDSAKKTNEVVEPKEAVIILKNEHVKIKINSGQVNLRSFIKIATDSNGNNINIGLINAKCKFINCTNGILPSQTKPFREYITYSYDDPITGKVSKSLIIDFIDSFNPNFEFTESVDAIIPNPIKNGYTLDEDTSFKELVQQINSLKPNDYSCLIACSIRSIFELGASDLYSTAKYKEIIFDRNLPETIYRIINYAQSNKQLLQYIDNNTKLGYTSLKDNVLLPEQYKEAIFIAHKGAHKSTKFLSLSELKSLGSKVSYFIILINEMLKFK